MYIRGVLSWFSKGMLTSMSKERKYVLIEMLFRMISRTLFPTKKRNWNHRKSLGSRRKKRVLLAQSPRPFLPATRWASPCSTRYGREPGGCLAVLNLVQVGPFEYRDWDNMYKYIFLVCRLHRQPKLFLFPKCARLTYVF